MWCILAFVVAMMACFAVAEPIYQFLAKPLQHALVKRGHDPTIVFLGAHKLFFTYISVSMFGGFFLSFPIIANQFWRFVAPGLYKSEQNAALPEANSAEEVGTAAAFLCSPLASGITGETLHVDKGYHAMGMQAETQLSED